MTQLEFIEKIAPLCQKYAKKYGFKVASPAIAQACLESAYGTSSKAQHYNFFGLKYRSNRVSCNCGTFVDGGSEQKKDGSYIPITDQWFEFNSYETGIEGYYQFINIPNYAKVKAATTPLDYLNAIKAAGYATSLKYVDNVYAVIQKWNLIKYDNLNVSIITPTPISTTKSINSPLVDCVVKSPNHSGTRTHKIDRITPHCVVGQLGAEAIGNCFPASRQASCNYGIGYDGRVVLVVDEDKRSWCSSSSANDQRAVTIECASDKTTPYAFNDKVYNKLIDICVDICQRNGKNKLLWINDKTTALAYEPKDNEMLLTVHRWFAAKACPGDWLMARMGNLASTVTQRLAGTQVQATSTQPKDTSTAALPYIVRVTDPALNVRALPNANKTTAIQTVIRDKGLYTIVEEQNGWGLLKSYQKNRNGWIKLSYTQKQ